MLFSLATLGAALGACAARVQNPSDSGAGADTMRLVDGATVLPDGALVLEDGATIRLDGALDRDGEFSGDDARDDDARDASTDEAVSLDGRVDPRDAGRDVVRDDVRLRDVPVVITDATFREDACPPVVGPARREYECDPYAPRSMCAGGEACYPFIEYPPEPCAREIYRARCLPAGTTPVNGSCRGGDCVPGSSCFVTGAGNRCLQLCRLDGSGTPCPRGQVCEPTDSPDVGACD